MTSTSFFLHLKSRHTLPASLSRCRLPMSFHSAVLPQAHTALTHRLSTFFNNLHFLSLSHTHTLSHSHSLPLSLSHTHTHTHTPFQDRQLSKQRNPSSPAHHALPPPFHHNRHLRHHPHPHPPSPHNLNTDSIRHERNGSNNSSPRTIPPPPDIDPPPRRHRSRHLSHPAHGIPPLRASARLRARSWLPAREPGHPAERG